MLENYKPDQDANQQLLTPVEQVSIESLYREVTALEKDVREQRNDSRNIIYAVIVAVLFVFLTVGVEVMLFHTR